MTKVAKSLKQELDTKKGVVAKTSKRPTASKASKKDDDDLDEDEEVEDDFEDEEDEEDTFIDDNEPSANEIKPEVDFFDDDDED